MQKPMQKSVLMTLFLALLMLVSIPQAFAFASAGNAATQLDNGQLNSNTTQVNVWFFYSQSCPHCHKVLSSGVLESINANVTMFKLDGSDKNIQIFQQVVQNYNIMAGVPTAVVFTKDPMNGSVLQGDDPIIQNLASYVEKYETGLENKTQNKTHPQVVRNRDVTPVNRDLWSDLAFILGVALADSINPCIMAVMIIMLATLASMKDLRKITGFGLLYILTVYLSYLVIGIALMLGAIWLINQLALFATAFTTATKIAVAGILVIAGLINIKDFFFWGKGITFNITEEHKKKVIQMAKKASIAAVLSIAVFVTIVEFPCSGIMYLGAIFYFVSSGINPWQLFAYLLIYNVIFVLPLVLILVAVLLTTLASRTAVESAVGKTRDTLMKLKEWFRLIMGIALIALAYLILIT